MTKKVKDGLTGRLSPNPRSRGSFPQGPCKEIFRPGMPNTSPYVCFFNTSLNKRSCPEKILKVHLLAMWSGCFTICEVEENLINPAPTKDPEMNPAPAIEQEPEPAPATDTELEPTPAMEPEPAAMSIPKPELAIISVTSPEPTASSLQE